MTDCKTIAVMIVPTGIGAAIGGHAGDATPAARVLAAACDTLIVHPNVVNGSQINEMPENSLYVDGWMLDRFLEGSIRLRPVLSNRILVASNAPVPSETVNAVSAARATLGGDAQIVELATPLMLTAAVVNGIADGEVRGRQELVAQIEHLDFDALAIATPIDVSRDVAERYLRSGGTNPWGGVEAKASRSISRELGDKPVAHAPVESGTLKDFCEVVDPRMAAEVTTETYLHSVLKGLHRAPRPDAKCGLSTEDVTCLVSPWCCVGRPHRAALAAGIPVIAVRENTTVCCDDMPSEFIRVENYLEAAGYMLAMKEGIHPPAVRRPLRSTCITATKTKEGEQ